MSSRGSEWNIWDLHVHTPASLVNGYVASSDCDVWENYIRDLELLPKEIKVLGINDYLFIDGYRRVREYKDKGRLPNIELILPVVEFRLSQFCGNEKFKRVNFHVIFSDQIAPDVIQNQFLNALSAKYQLSPEYNAIHWSGVIDKENLCSLGQKIKESVPQKERECFGPDLLEGFNNLNLDYNEITGILERGEQFFKGKFLTAIGKSEWDDIKWNDNTIAEKKNLINRVDFVFTAAESVEKYHSSLDKLKLAGVNSRLLDCSDAHYNLSSSIKDRLGNCHCWIKAETSFEGLKQVLFEPEERLMVSLMEPQRKNAYQVIDRIELDEASFWNDVIPLNPNLNTIIGGRATGKSTLLKAMAAKQQNVHLKEEDDFTAQHLAGVRVVWADGAEHPDNQIDFFQQSYMHDLAESESLFNSVLKGIIAEKDEHHLLSSYEASNRLLKASQTHDILAVFQCSTKRHAIADKIREKGNKEGIIREVSLLKEKLQELSKGASLSDDEINQCQLSSEEITRKETLISAATRDIELLSNAGGSIVGSDYLRRTGLDGLEFNDNQRRVQDHLDGFKSKIDEEWRIILSQLETSTRESMTELSKEISQIKESDIYKRGQKFYSDNKEIGDLKIKIQDEERKLTEIEALEKEYKLVDAECTRLFESIIANHLKYGSYAQEVVDDLHFETDGLMISAKRRLRSRELNGFLEGVLNVRSYERQDFLEKLENEYADHTEQILTEYLHKALAGEIVLKNYNEIQQVTTQFLSENWYEIDYELQYQNDTFKQMSSGKQAFVILKLLLDFSDKKNPILIDQPEDSLDNRAIYNELVSYIVRKKKERQIILVTHNPNVVVSADSENVIVANQQGNDCKNENGCRFHYVNGALESNHTKNLACEYVLSSQGIREHVCEILEGGEVAFIKREQKYGLKSASH